MPKYNRLFIPEKASAGESLAEYLSKTTKQPIRNQPGFIQVGNDVIAPMSGHLLEQVEAHEYDPKFKTWDLEHLPIIPNPFRLAVKPDDAKRNIFPGRKVKVIKDLLGQCDQVIGYGDPDAEGQLLQDELLIFLGNKKPVLRLWCNALDDTSLQRALSSMRPNQDYVGWYEAALFRSQLDWLYGINMTRACTLHARAAGADMLVTIGRVQTPTLALVVERELAIRNFKPIDYFVPIIDVFADPAFRATWRPRLNAEKEIDDPRVDVEGRLLGKPDADAIAAACKAAGRATVASVETKPGTESAPLPFALSALQAHCSRLFGFSAKQTLDTAQSLYRKKITSYPRVDCGYLPESQHADAPRILASLGKAQLPSAFGSALLGARPQLKSKAWDDSKVTAHHAIVPVHLDNPGVVAKLDENELKVYLEIVKRYVLQFWPPAKFTATEAVLKCGQPGAEEDFVVKGKRYQDEGWRNAFALPNDDEDDEDDGAASLPTLTKGQSMRLSAAGVDSKRTQPPRRFTEGTLITAMRNIYLYVKDPEYRRRLQAKDGGGIGTEATRAAMIEQMVCRDYLSVVNKELVPSEETIKFITMLPGAMKTPDMTAMWNLMTDDVMARKSTHPALIAKMIPWLKKLVDNSGAFFTVGQFAGMKPQGGKPRVAQTAFTCFGSAGKPGCGAALRLIPGKPGQGGYKPFFGCSNQDCKKTFNEVDGKPMERAPRVEAHPDAPKYDCAACKAGALRLVPRRDGSGSFWGCSNFRNGCRTAFNDLEGKPDFEGATKKQAGGADAPVDPKHACPACEKGFLARRERNDKSGYFWGCTAWREGCKAIYSDLEGAPDIEGKSRKGGWQNGAPTQVRPRNSGHSSGYRGGRAVVPQMHGPTPK